MSIDHEPYDVSTEPLRLVSRDCYKEVTEVVAVTVKVCNDTPGWL